MKVLVIGSGGREHCLAWKISQSKLVDKIYIAPGNAGTALVGENVDIDADDLEGLLKLAKAEDIGLVVVGPETPLVAGIVDKFEAAGIKIFGPRKNLALLEGSKVFAKEVLKKFGIPTAAFKSFTDTKEAKKYIDKIGAPLVVKADGLAAGKGVIVCRTAQEAYDALDLIMQKRSFGCAGDKIVIEGFLEGQEASILVFTDGETIIPLVASQDHKQILDGDKGPNTGGMGAYSPTPLVDEAMLGRIMKEIFEPLIFGLKKEGKIYKGILYAGLMINNGQPAVLEFNVRFGDPETQAILPKLKSDLAEVMLRVVDGSLKELKLKWDKRFCLCVVLASGGYPDNYEKGKIIKGLEQVNKLKDIFIFHAGTKRTADLVTDGGRVLNVVGLGQDIKEAQGKVYQAIKNIHFDGMYYRKDIGNKALKYGK